MALLSKKVDYSITKNIARTRPEFSPSSKVFLSILLIPLLFYYTLLLAGALTMAYYVYPIGGDKVISYLFLVLWTLSGFMTSLTGFIIIVKFRWETVIISLASLSSALFLEYSLTIYEYQEPKVSFFLHIIVLLQLILILVLSAIAFTLKNRGKSNGHFISESKEIVHPL